MSFSAKLDNRTPFSAQKLAIPDREGQEAVLVIVTATFAAESAGKPLELAERQSPIRLADEYTQPDAPERSSVLYEADVALEKQSVDVLVRGSAYAPNGRPATTVPVALAAGDVLKKLLVSGDRDWHGALDASPSKPQPFVRMPIVYERAFGGTTSGDAPAVYRQNPVGIGYKGALSGDPEVRSQVANIEYLDALIGARSDERPPAGIGPVGRGWTPRLGLAGTFDQRWREERWPFLPADFDARHYQAAPPDQQSRTLRGGDVVRLVNLTPEGLWQFRLPSLDVPMLLLFSDRAKRYRLRFDTVLVEPDEKRVSITMRAAVRTLRNRGMLREIVIGHRSSAYIRACLTGKKFVDGGGSATAAFRPRLYTL